MKQIKSVLSFFGRMDRGLYPVLLLAALLETLEGFGVLLISSTVLNRLAAGAGMKAVLTTTAVMVLAYGILHYFRMDRSGIRITGRCACITDTANMW